jgi:hypothetical protein
MFKVEYGCITINITKNLFAELHCDWLQIFGKYNWYECNILQVYFENDSMTGGYEFEFYILGFGMRVRYNYSDKLEKLVDDAFKE